MVSLAGARWRVDSVQSPAPGKDEDALLVETDFVGVADGSTPLVEGLDIDARAYAEGALGLLRENSHLPLDEMFRNALAAAAEAPSVERGPSCTVAVVTARDGALEAAVLGDSTVVFEAADGSAETLSDDRLQPFDEPVALEIAAATAAGAEDATKLPEVIERLTLHRRMANDPDSYWIFAGNPRAADEIRTRALPVAGVRAVLIFSDGFARIVDPLRLVPSYEALLRRACEEGLRALVDELRAAEREPRSMVEAPRLSVEDDATAVLLIREEIG